MRRSGRTCGGRRSGRQQRGSACHFPVPWRFCGPTCAPLALQLLWWRADSGANEGETGMGNDWPKGTAAAGSMRGVAALANPCQQPEWLQGCLALCAW